MWRWLPLAVAACINPSLVTCPESGLVCPSDTTCDDLHHTCVTPEQQQVCIGLADGTGCTAGSIIGYCTDQVCLPIACGNEIIEPGEVCDDGNAIDGDGCNATCTSTEVCGNGVRDPGEACDDGNRLSGDGCDSRCQPEQETWTVTGIHTAYHAPNNTVFDPVHHQLVHVADARTWTWDGAAWSILNLDALGTSSWNWDALVFDPDRGTVLLVGKTYSQTNAEALWEWDGTTWTELGIAGTAPHLISGTIVTYDSARHLVLALGTTNNFLELWSLDVATRTWTMRTSPQANYINFTGNEGFAFDATRNVAVYVQTGATPGVYEWNGTAWTAKNTAAMPVAGGWAVIYDPSLAAVIAIGGINNSTAVSKWTGSAWVALTSLPLGRALADVAYDTDRQRLIVFGGKDASNLSLSDLLERKGTSQWDSIPITTPPVGEGSNGLFEAYDERRDELITLGGVAPNGNTDAWAWNGATWHRLPPLPVVFNLVSSAIIYDPVRGGFIVNSTDQSTWLLHDEVWTNLEPAGTSDPFGMIGGVYDPTRHAIIATDGYSTWTLPSNATKWTMFGPPPDTHYYQTWAFDARRGHVVVIVYTMGYELVDTTWKPTLTPGILYKIVADQRRGSIVSLGQLGDNYERADGVWHPSPRPVPNLGFGFALMYAPRTGAVIAMGEDEYSRLEFRRTFVGATPFDTCDGSDADGDGLTSCADPDCWLTCAPACPPYASCP